MSNNEPLPSDTVDLLRSLGAPLQGSEESTPPVHFGSWQSEYRTLTQAAGWTLVTWRTLVHVVGADALRFLNGQMTCEVTALPAGGVVYGFFTNAKGRVMADARVLRSGGRLFLDLPTEVAEELIGHLEKYALFDDVRFELLAERYAVSVAGQQAVSGLFPARGAELEPWKCTSVEWPSNDSTAIVARFPRWGLDQLSVWIDAGVLSAAVSECTALELAPVGSQAVDTLRVERGLSRFGVDFDTECIPQETGREAEAVDYSKGCYLGQEVVARVHYLGQPSRALMRVVAEDGALATGDEILADDQVLGRVTTVVNLPEQVGALGLAILRQKPLQARPQLMTSAGVAVTVEIPTDERG